MSLTDCITRAVDSGLISKRRAANYTSQLSARMQDYAHLGPGAEMAAARDVWTQLRVDAATRKRVTLLQASKAETIIRNVTDFVDSDGTQNPARGVRQLLEWGQSATFQSVGGVQDALTQQYRRGIGKFIEQHKRNIAGQVREKARLPDIVREMMGEGTGSVAARQMAEALTSTFEQARLDFNAAGGSIGKLDDFGLPHSWDKNRMLSLDKDRKVARDIWVNQVADGLDWDRIIDRNTSRPFSSSSAAARGKFLSDIFDTITESGWNKREPSGVAMGKSTANTRADERVLHFKSADAWLSANDAFGRSDIFGTVVSHLDGMARDTAMMRVLGPNPRAGLQLAIQTAEKMANENPWVPTRTLGVKTYSTAAAEVNAAKLQSARMFDIIDGSANSPEMDVVSSAFSGVRHFLIASQLGGAMLSAVSDVGFLGAASRHVGMKPQKVIGRQLKAIASSGQRGLMARAGIIADSAANVGVVQARLMGDAYGPAVAANLSEFTMRASGLSAWTDISRGAFRLEFYGHLADNASKSWADLDAPLRQLVFEARGITPDDWDVIRATQLFRDEVEPDAAFLVPSDIRNRTDIDRERAMDLSLKLESAIMEQMEFAIPSTSIRGRAAFSGGAPGSWTGEMMRSGLMYKSFTLSLMYNQLGRVFYHKVNGSRAANILAIATMTTVAGALSIQLKEMAKGRDPRDMTTGEFWKAAALQGGGLGILGDFVYASENRFGGGLAATVAGPVVGLVNDATYLTGDIANALRGDDDAIDKAQRNAVKFLDRYSGPTNLWYANTALNRLLWDNLTEFFDPEAGAALAQQERKRVKEYGNQSYWQPGQAAPDRGPDLSQIIGGAQQ